MTPAYSCCHVPPHHLLMFPPAPEASSPPAPFPKISFCLSIRPPPTSPRATPTYASAAPRTENTQLLLLLLLPEQPSLHAAPAAAPSPQHHHHHPPPPAAPPASSPHALLSFVVVAVAAAAPSPHRLLFPLPAVSAPLRAFRQTPAPRP